ncbi:MAG: prepilin-type N-terminal cleavage/methylation domain-containing protein [Planctomycetes bacterium]|nr:prepilin-type N-terminal cleavage/methylation domain-containing protein [Planctomycetota bacterium]
MGRSRNSAFTLVELMVSMAVAALLAATSLVALWGAQQQASESRSHAQVAKIGDLVTTHWETYPTRKLAITYSVPGAETPRDRLEARLWLLRDTMRMELPDRKSDIIVWNGSAFVPAGPISVTLAESGVSATIQPPRLLRRYVARAARQLQLRQKLATTVAPDWELWTEWNQHAECLYLILAELQDQDGPALAYFRSTEIQDTDDDGMPEILDGWGTPLQFLRWAPGFLQDSTIQTGNRNRQPDHLDPLYVDARWKIAASLVPYSLFPLVFSMGPDREPGLISDNQPPGVPPPQPPTVIPGNGVWSHNYRAVTPLMDPYGGIQDINPVSSSPYLIGERNVNNSYADDNISSHLIEIR